MSDNPFSEELDAEEMNAIGFSTIESIPTPNFEENNSVQEGENDLKAQKESKMARLKLLKDREQELLRRQQMLDDQNLSIIPSNNWPSFFPIIRYNLEEDIPHSAQKTIINARNGLIFYFAAILFNLIAILSVRISGYHHVRNFIFACIQGVAGMYFALNFSYSKLYSACHNKDIPFSWTFYEFILIGWMAYLFIGFPTSGSVGLATFLDLIAKGSPFFSKFVALLNTTAISFAIYFEFRTLISAQGYQKVSGLEDQLLGVAGDIAHQVIHSTAQFVAQSNAK